MGYRVNDIVWSIGGPESPIGTAAARTVRLHVRGNPSLGRKPGRTPDPAISGNSMEVGDYLTSDDVSGAIPLSPRAGAGFGKIVKSCMGTESAPAQIAACIRVRYTGANASCKMISDTAANTLRATTGAIGAEVNDAQWNGGNPLDLTAAPSDTVGEIVTLIDGYTGFDCEKVFGDNSVSAGLITTDLTGQAKNQWSYFWFTGGATAAYQRAFTLDLTTTERPGYSIQGEGYCDQFLYSGCVVDALSFNAQLKGILESDADILGFTEGLAAGAGGLTLADLNPLFFWNGSFSLGANVFPYIKSFSLKIDNRSNRDGYGQGSVGRLYQQKGIPEITGSMEIPLDANMYAQRASLFSTTTTAYAAASAYFKGKDIGSNVNLPEMLLIEMPFLQITSFEFGESAGNFTARVNFKVIYPKGTLYDLPLTIHMISADSGAY
jgi:hypothetical protein